MSSACGGPSRDQQSPGHLRGPTGLLMRIRGIHVRQLFTWQLAQTLAMGQGLAVLICGTAVSSQYLATNFQVNTPMLQSFLNYVLLCSTYTTMLLCRTGDGSLVQILKNRWWRYLLLALVDVEANYTVVKAYQYTTITSVQLLDSFVVPVLMFLSWWILKTRYRLVHYVAVGVCLLGVGAMVGADLLAGRDPGSTSNVLLGDGLVLLSAALYAVTNVCQEYTVRSRSREEFLGLVGLFGTVISSLQMVILERHDITNITWSWQVGLLLAAFALCLYSLYSCMPIVIQLSSATSVNLSLLTADLFSLFCGIFLFQYTFSGLYLVSLVLILLGFITFNAVPTPAVLSHPSSSSSSSSLCEEGHCDTVTGEREEVGVEEVKEEQEQRERRRSSVSSRSLQGDHVGALERSTKM